MWIHLPPLLLTMSWIYLCGHKKQLWLWKAFCSNSGISDILILKQPDISVIYLNLFTIFLRAKNQCEFRALHMVTWIQRSLLKLWDFLHQCSVVGVQASVCDQQEATQPSVPRMSSLQAVLTGHIKASLQRRRHTGNVSCYVGQWSPPS